MLIQTRFIGPTNYRGARIKAIAVGRDRSITVPYGYALAHGEAHAEAAKALLAKLANEDTSESYGRPDYLLVTTPVAWDDRGAFFVANGPHAFPMAADWSA